jgi:hypothetical protein
MVLGRQLASPHLAAELVGDGLATLIGAATKIAHEREELNG